MINSLTVAKQLESLRQGTPLYVSRPLITAHDFFNWAVDQGFGPRSVEVDLHVTLIYSRQPVVWSKFYPQRNIVLARGGERKILQLGDEGAVVLLFECPQLVRRHEEFRVGGCSFDYDYYKPHTTITYRPGALDLSKVEPYPGDMEFGAERWRRIKTKA